MMLLVLLLNDLNVAVGAAKLENEPLFEAFMVESVSALWYDFDLIASYKVRKTDRAAPVLEERRAVTFSVHSHRLIHYLVIRSIYAIVLDSRAVCVCLLILGFVVPVRAQRARHSVKANPGPFLLKIVTFGSRA